MTSTIIGADTAGAVSLAGGEYVLILATGTLRNSLEAVVVTGGGADVTNLGTIYTAGFDQEGIYLTENAYASILNDGLIRTSGDAIEGDGTTSIVLVNTADGVISPFGPGAIAIRVGTADIQNAGLIAGNISASSASLFGSYLANSGTIGGEVFFTGVASEATNEGLIQGNLSLNGSNSRVFNTGTIDGTVGVNGTLENYGLIRRSVSTSFDGAADDVVLNAGTIGGAVNLALGADLYDGREGLAFGVVYGDLDYAPEFGTDADTLLGGRGAETFAGGGGEDELDGGAGDDVLMGEGGGDILIGGEGFDYASYASALSGVPSGTGVVASLADPSVNDGSAEGDQYFGIEGLIGSSYADLLVGNAASNQLRGGAGSDALDGGAGADTMRGGDGGDVFFVDNAGDVVFDSAGLAGFDLVQASVSHALQLTAEIEQLQTADAGATTAINLTGSNTANTIIGNAGNNVLRGRGGADTLDGGAGNDTIWGNQGSNDLRGATGQDRYVFDAPLTGTGSGIQRVLGFNATDDTIALSRGVYFDPGTGTTPLAPGAFALGTAATTAAHRVIYDGASGKLFYDADGVGGAAKVQIGLLLNGLGTSPAAGVSAADFVFIG
jgi:Ca2+-binding RTX toxin-like protein